jgi:hypothetical protein
MNKNTSRGKRGYVCSPGQGWTLFHLQMQRVSSILSKRGKMYLDRSLPFLIVLVVFWKIRFRGVSSCTTKYSIQSSATGATKRLEWVSGQEPSCSLISSSSPCSSSYSSAVDPPSLFSGSDIWRSQDRLLLPPVSRVFNTLDTLLCRRRTDGQEAAQSFKNAGYSQSHGANIAKLPC